MLLWWPSRMTSLALWWHNNAEAGLNLKEAGRRTLFNQEDGDIDKTLRYLPDLHHLRLLGLTPLVNNHLNTKWVSTPMTSHSFIINRWFHKLWIHIWIIIKRTTFMVLLFDRDKLNFDVRLNLHVTY